MVKSVDGSYHLFYGERAPNTTYSWKMGWTTQTGHWASTDKGMSWSRVETVARGGLWSTMPLWDPVDDVWKLFFVDESTGRGMPGVMVAGNKGPSSLSTPQNWTKLHFNLTTPTFSVSNPFEVGGAYYIFT